MAPDSRSEQAMQIAQPRNRPRIVETEQPAVSDHVGIDGGFRMADVLIPSCLTDQDIQPASGPLPAVCARTRVPKG